MGMFFLISAYFTVHSLERKPIARFSSDRLKRLGIPLLLFYFILSPVVNYILVRWRNGEVLSFFGFIKKYQGFGFGPMWFVEALLYFTFLYLGYYYFFERNKSTSRKDSPLPGNWQILLFALILGLCSFIIRIWLPVGWEFRPLSFQIPFFVQYTTLFVVGILAYKYSWLESITYKTGIRWFVFAQICIFFLFPALFILGGGGKGELDMYMGGLHWQSLAYAIWEQVTGISLIIGLFALFKQKVNKQGKLAQILSKSAYAVFLIHPLVLVTLALGLKGLHLYPLLKYIILAPFAVMLCFVFATGFRKLPLLRKIL